MGIEKCTVYALAEPNSIKIRYVGQTIWSAKYRLTKHINNAIKFRNKSHLYTWLRKLNKENKKPSLFVLEHNAIWNDSEVFWIKALKDFGFDLMNHTNGGNGILGYKHTEDAKKKIGKASNGNKYAMGIKQSEETKIKRANKLKKKVKCIETNKVYLSARDAELELGVSKGCITHVVRGDYKKSAGFHWEYV